MKIGILSKRTGGFTQKIKDYYESIGHQVKIFTADNLCINKTLLENDFYILKSKHLLYLYAGYFLEANMVPVIPNTSLSHTHKDRIECYFAIKNTGLTYPHVYMGSLKTLKKLLQNSYFPLIYKPILGSGSNDIRILNSMKDLNQDFEEPLYLEKYIDGVHYLAYFIGDNFCICEKQPLSNEHSRMTKIEFDEEIEDYLRKWRKKYNILFGHLDLVREIKSNQLHVVDAGTFPEFSNWKQEINPISSVCNLILKKYREIKK
jgi:glutathione synthase/RimK-type ligase-like ATP-grasp enzyme